MNGIVIIDKPEGWTSQDVTARLRRVFNTRRIGHGGTLDPMATGVLPVFVGRATRGVEFFEHAEKTYETVLRLGITTDTEDISGTVLTEQDAFVTGEQLEAVLETFRGEILQVPPMYSALKVNGPGPAEHWSSICCLTVRRCCALQTENCLLKCQYWWSRQAHPSMTA